MATSKTTKLDAKLALSKAGQVYKPSANSAQGNAASWELLQAQLAKGPKTRKELEDLLQKERNHKPFVGYAIRRGWLEAK